MHKVKKTIKKLPVVGSIAEKGAQIIRIRKDVQGINTSLSKHAELIHKLNLDIERLENKLVQSEKDILNNQENLTKKFDNLSDMMEDFIHNVKISSATKNNDVIGKSNLFADNHALDRFYLNFENNFRGEEKLILDRLSVYIDRFNDANMNSKKYPVIDIGCGRGEMLTLLSEKGINAIGIDLNLKMVENAKEKGLVAVQANAIDYLRSLKTSSVSAITGFHIIEHIPFEGLVELFEECHRVLRKGGFIIFETPNPENIDVATINFYMDPSHLKPLPPSLINFLAISQGYQNVEIIRLHPLEFTDIDTDNIKYDQLQAHINSRFTAPLDYSVIAYK